MGTVGVESVGVLGKRIGGAGEYVNENSIFGVRGLAKRGVK